MPEAIRKNSFFEQFFVLPWAEKNRGILLRLPSQHTHRSAVFRQTSQHVGTLLRNSANGFDAHCSYNRRCPCSMTLVQPNKPAGCTHRRDGVPGGLSGDFPGHMPGHALSETSPA
jgi:hypothetical protein